MDIKRRYTIKQLLQNGFGLAILVVFLIGGLAYLQFGRSVSRVSSVISNDAPLIIAAEIVKSDMLMHRRYEKDFFLNIGKADKQAAYLENYNTQSKEILSGIKTINEIVSRDNEIPASEKNQAERLEQSYLQYRNGFLAVMDKVRNDPSITPQQANEMMADAKAAIHAFEEALSVISATALQMFEQNTASAVALSNLTKNVLIVAVVAGLILLVGLTIGINRLVVGTIIKISARVADCLQAVSGAADQIAAGSEVMAEGASQQAASIEETSTSLEEIDSKTKRNADGAAQANTMMHDAGRIIGEASAAMNELHDSLREISKASNETSRVVKTIEEIAFQTNLLALNASVEAARAGEAGAGFAVVADEVRNLALRASKSAHDTAALIKDTTAKVATGSDLMARSNKVFAGLSEVNDKVGHLVSGIANASNEQADGIGQIALAVTEMNGVTQRNAAHAEESSAASHSLTGQMRQLENLIEELHAFVGHSHRRTLRLPATVSGPNAPLPSRTGWMVSKGSRPTVLHSRTRSGRPPLKHADRD